MIPLEVPGSDARASDQGAASHLGGNSIRRARALACRKPYDEGPGLSTEAGRSSWGLACITFNDFPVAAIRRLARRGGQDDALSTWNQMNVRGRLGLELRTETPPCPSVILARTLKSVDGPRRSIVAAFTSKALHVAFAATNNSIAIVSAMPRTQYLQTLSQFRSIRRTTVSSLSMLTCFLGRLLWEQLYGYASCEFQLGSLVILSLIGTTSNSSSLLWVF